jgi:hypothetical protein
MSNPNITYDLLQDNDLYINYEYFSRNQHLTDEFIKNNIDYNWDFHEIGANPSITFNTFFICPTDSQNSFIRGYSKNPNLTIQNIINHIDEVWDMYQVCNNPALTFDMIMELHEKIDVNDYFGSSYAGLSANPNITLDIIEQNKSINWVDSGIIQNPNINWDYILNNINIVNMNQKYILQNNFTYCETVYKRQCANIIITAPFIIQYISTIICQYVR